MNLVGKGLIVLRLTSPTLTPSISAITFLAILLEIP